MQVERILLISDGAHRLARMRSALTMGGFIAVDSLADAAAVVIFAADPTYALVRVQQIRSSSPQLPILLANESGSEKFVASAFHAGINHYLCGPWTAEELISALSSLSRSHSSEIDDIPVDGQVLVGGSESMSSIRKDIGNIARTDSSVLILGETGTGKELIAELIHRNSPRRQKPFVCVNSAAIPEALVESELFGFERGAFTGALEAQPGKLCAGNRGTVFLDEIGDVSLGVQAKLLRAIESRKIYRLGSTRPIDLDIRVVAATNQDLDRAINENRFRQDLYYRLNVVRIEIPPLRNRREDICSLVAHFIEYFNRRFHRHVAGLSARALDVLMAYDWPGNIRELRNVLEALFVSLCSDVAGLVDLPPQVIQRLKLMVNTSQTERDAILRTLTATRWNKSEAALQLHWSRMTLYRKMSRYQIPKSA